MIKKKESSLSLLSFPFHLLKYLYFTTIESIKNDFSTFMLLLCLTFMSFIHVRGRSGAEPGFLKDVVTSNAI